ncbi:MAG: M56 family metallopeptidase [Gemmatimonadales bacterium]
MIGSWMLSAMIIGALLGGGALCLSGFGTSLALPRRWLWLAIMLVSLMMPVGLALRSRPSPTPKAAPTAPITTVTVGATITPVDDRPDYDRLLLIVWGFASLALAGLFGASHRRTLTLLRTWRHSELHGAAVVVSPNFGPAAVGLLRSQIVVPAWVLDLPDDEQRLVLGHELEHIRAGDQFVLFAGVLFAVLMPWNVPLWWQLRRLRIGIELDCDARVAPRLRDRPRYANLLLRARTPRRTDQMALAFFPSRSTLAERLLALLDRARPTRRRMAMSSVSMVACVGALARVPVPNLSSLLPRFTNTASSRHSTSSPATLSHIAVGRPVSSTDGQSAVPAHPAPTGARRVRYDSLLPIDSTVLLHQSFARGGRASCIGCTRAISPDTTHTSFQP